jgi:hypothetical protein
MDSLVTKLFVVTNDRHFEWLNIVWSRKNIQIVLGTSIWSLIVYFQRLVIVGHQKYVKKCANLFGGNFERGSIHLVTTCLVIKIIHARITLLVIMFRDQPRFGHEKWNNWWPNCIYSPNTGYLVIINFVGHRRFGSSECNRHDPITHYMRSNNLYFWWP